MAIETIPTEVQREEKVKKLNRVLVIYGKIISSEAYT